jgi:diaminohydroxyphosphoribosylaminopyrimidine deaminase/5-amino-6-(5-phosphoribosylamino)uracil reductase
VADQLAPYLKHRRTGRPWVVLKLAATLDGRTAAPDGSSRWITGAEARADDPRLTVRLVEGADPLRVVLGRAPADALVQPVLELGGDPGAILDDLGGRGVVQVLIEGGATVAGAFHRASLVDRYVLYLAPKLLGGDDGPGLFVGPGAATLAGAWQGRLVDVERLGDDLRVELAPVPAPLGPPRRSGLQNGVETTTIGRPDGHRVEA